MGAVKGAISIKDNMSAVLRSIKQEQSAFRRDVQRHAGNRSPPGIRDAQPGLTLQRQTDCAVVRQRLRAAASGKSSPPWAIRGRWPATRSRRAQGQGGWKDDRHAGGQAEGRRDRRAV